MLISFQPGLKDRLRYRSSLKRKRRAIDANDVRKILLACNNRRLKTYLLVLASGGIRAVEGLAIRLGDIDFNLKPTKIHIRAQFSKTRRARDIYISDEATKHLQNWIDWRYRVEGGKNNNRPKSKDDLIFHLWNINEKSNPRTLYFHVSDEFAKLLDVAGFAERKEDGHKHRVTLKSFRSFVYTTISTVDYEYAEWFLGHSKSVYWRKKEPERREIYRIKCMKHLTFLDFTVLEARGRSIEANLLEKDQQIQQLKEQMSILQQKYKSYDEMVKETLEKVKQEVFQKVEKDRKQQKEEDDRHRVLYDMLDKQFPGWDKKYHELLGLGPKPLTKEARKKIEDMLEWMRANPDTDYPEQQEKY